RRLDAVATRAGHRVCRTRLGGAGRRGQRERQGVVRRLAAARGVDEPGAIALRQRAVHQQGDRIAGPAADPLRARAGP
ncbi:hypothetical protein B8W90_12160, partial [Staphylococcus hominis]